MRKNWVISLAFFALAGQFTLALGLPVYSGLEEGGGNGLPDCCCKGAINSCCEMACQCTTPVGESSTRGGSGGETPGNWEIHWLNPVNNFQCQGGNPSTLPGCELYIQKSEGLEFYISESASSPSPLIALHQVLFFVDTPPPRR